MSREATPLGILHFTFSILHLLMAIASIAMSSIPVREYVIASITQSAAPAICPTHRHTPPHPQQNGNISPITATARFGL